MGAALHCMVMANCGLPGRITPQKMRRRVSASWKKSIAPHPLIPSGEAIMKALIPIVFAAFLPSAFALPAEGHEVPDPSIVHHAQDGVVRLYGAGGPDTAFRKVAEVFRKETGIGVDVTAGPEPSWTRQAQANADILWGTSEEDITALLETYKDFSSADVTPIYIRPTIIAVKKSNPKHIRGFEDLLKDGMRVVVTEAPASPTRREPASGRMWPVVPAGSTTSGGCAGTSSPSARAAEPAIRPSPSRTPTPGSPGQTGRLPISTKPNW